MRLIDADKLKKELEVNGLGYQYYMLDNAPTVEAIPVEWIKKWCNEHNRKSLEERLLKRYGVITMLEDWEKENQSLE